MAAPKVRKGRRVICHATGIYPSASPLLRAHRSYQVVTRLQIGCFVLAAGRLVFLPAALQGKTYLLVKGVDPPPP